MSTVFGSDRVLLYDVDPWNRLGFGAPNFGNNVGSLSLPISSLVDEIGQIQLYVMTHVDAMRKQPPGINTVRRIGGMCNRIQTVLAGRQRTDPQTRLEPGHFTPAPEIFRIHPVPYFSGPIVRNKWLKEYNQLCMVGLTNMMQHSDNSLSLVITEKFASDIWQYFREIAILLGTELLGLSRAIVEEPTFKFEETHYATYNPSAVTVNVESIDSGVPLFGLPTEDDLEPLMVGIPANMIVPNLRQYPIGPVPGLEGISGADKSFGVPLDTGSDKAAGASSTIKPPTV
jgi:hypothetical protein